MTAMYAAILEDAGYEVETKLVDTRPAYLDEFPGSVDIVPEYVAGLGDQLNTDANGEDAAPISTSDLDETLTAMAPLLEEKGITLLAASEAASQNAYFVTQDYSEENGVTKLSDLEGQSIKLAAASRLRGPRRLRGGLTEVYGIDIELLPLGYAIAADLQVGDRRRVRSSARPAPSTAPSTTRAWSCSRTTAASSRRRTSCRPCPPSSWTSTPTSRSRSRR